MSLTTYSYNDWAKAHNTVRDLRIGAGSDPSAVWRKLNRIVEYLDERANEAFETEFAE